MNDKTKSKEFLLRKSEKAESDLNEKKKDEEQEEVSGSKVENYFDSLNNDNSNKEKILIRENVLNVQDSFAYTKALNQQYNINNLNYFNYYNSLNKNENKSNLESNEMSTPSSYLISSANTNSNTYERDYCSFTPK